ncbi:MAG: acetylesterase, partial [Akkermansiaceae bacterium]|nr:acetylesterase [Akkermansiaceae bacterium]
GRLGGYGALNQSGLVCLLSLVLGEKCGIDHPEVREAIERGNRFFGFFIGKGTVPYGDHRPKRDEHDDNGKNSIAAVLFDVQDHREGARFFSRMAVASYGERERGHTGNYFSYLWGGPGACRAGPEAAAAFLKEQRWYFDLSRSFDGRFRYQGGAASRGAEHKYGHFDCTGAFLLSYLLPEGRLFVTGKGSSRSGFLAGELLADTIAAGRGFDSWGKGLPHYRQFTSDRLMDLLTSWSPVVRFRAARVLAERPE